MSTDRVWVTDENDKVVKSAVMKPDQTVSYKVNTSKEDADVQVSSSNRAVVGATYKAGKLTLKARSNVTGLKQ